MLKLTCTGGRYPHGLYTPLRPENITACLTVFNGYVTIQVNDSRHDDRWEHFEIPVDELMAFLESADGQSGNETAANRKLTGANDSSEQGMVHPG